VEDYQVDGYDWCLAREQKQYEPKQRGGLIADEMGLGKTTLILGLIKHNRVKRTLIVVPSMLLQQWKAEITRTLGIEPHLYHGKGLHYCYQREAADNLIRVPLTDEIFLKYSIVLTSYGSKIDAIIKKIKENQVNNKRKLVFCHYTDEIMMLKTRICDETSLTVSVIKGGMSSKSRTLILADKEINVLLMQIKTGSEGLNLQQYSEVYFTSPHWNPSVEDQALARVHRMGQANNVMVYKFIMDNISTGDNSKDGINLSLDGYSELVQKTKRELQKEWGLLPSSTTDTD
jgi:SNF2 family DNA or RNA helicase